jgi:uncharacterized membrane protein YhaH (DUF805 family)
MTYLGACILALALQWSQSFLRFSGRWTPVPTIIPTVMLFIVLLLLPQASLKFARLHEVRRTERISTVRDTVIGMVVLFVVMAIISGFLSATNLNRFALGMCTALIALSLVPLTGWAGQVSLAPLAFAGIGAVAYSRLGGAEGHGYAVILAALVVLPVGALLALPALRLQGLYLALATPRVRVAGSRRSSSSSPSRSEPRAVRPAASRCSASTSTAPEPSCCS